jgi:hypothetical protein
MWCRRWSAMDRPGSMHTMISAELFPQCKATTCTRLPSAPRKSHKFAPQELLLDYRSRRPFRPGQNDYHTDIPGVRSQSGKFW